MKSKRIVRLLKETFAEWQKDRVPLLAASLAYYTVFSIAPLLLISIAIAGAFFGDDAVRGEVFGQIHGLVGKEGAAAIQGMLQSTQKPNSGGFVTTIFSVITLLLGASGVFGQLQEALNIIWEVKPKPGRNLIKFVRARFLSSSMILVIAFLLLVSSILSAGLVAFTQFTNKLVPGLEILGSTLEFVLSLLLVTLLFAAIYKILPDVKVPWRNLWVGSAVTALFFNLGKILIGLYLGNSHIGSAFGAAGSVIVLLVWIFYSAQILLLGAEFTQVYSSSVGTPIQPSDYATSTDGSPER